MSAVLGVRHAEVENPEGVVYGRLAGFHLSAAGLEHAERVGALLASAPVVAVHASPLERAQETARALAAPHGLEVITDERLIEWVANEAWQGRSWKDLLASPEYGRVTGDPIRNAPLDPLDRVGERIVQWAHEAEAAHPEGMVLGVSHEAPLVAAYLWGRRGDFTTYKSVNIPHLSAVRLVPGPPELVDPFDAVSC
ncbi:MAG: histidine phosphatase family protein [Actinomycetota bacterium]|nr:histidine phosphatase family protein [Actinomycetota bacterium]